jgi:hypothetical protein
MFEAAIRCRDRPVPRLMLDNLLVQRWWQTDGWCVLTATCHQSVHLTISQLTWPAGGGSVIAAPPVWLRHVPWW